MSKVNPQIICLQETNFKGNFTASLKNFTGYSKNKITASRSSGGSTFYITYFIFLHHTIDAGAVLEGGVEM